MMNPLRSRRLALTAALIFASGVSAGFLWPNHMVIPVESASTSDWNHETFWYYPWGRSVVHKGIDIFADKGRAVLSATDGFVLSTDHGSQGGNTVTILGPRWRIHYYAHLDSMSVKGGCTVSRGEPIGAVGTSGNARGKPAHLHYSIITLFPYPWRIDSSPLGALKMFFLDPGQALADNRR